MLVELAAVSLSDVLVVRDHWGAWYKKFHLRVLLIEHLNLHQC